MIDRAADSATLAQWRKASVCAALTGVALCALGAVLCREQFFESYLFAFMFWFGMGIGCLGILMLHHVVGGAWGDLIRPLLEAGAMTLPWLAVLFVPLLLALPTLYPWARPAAVAADTLLQHKRIYLNVPFFTARAAASFALWCFMAYRLNQWSDPRDEAAAALASRRSAPGLLLYFVTLTFCLLDWTMSLEPHWYSTIYEAMVIVGQLLGALALMTCVLALFGNIRQLSEELPPKPFIDLGNMLLVFVMFWAYFSFSQYLVIWSANMPEEISWYLHRQSAGWFWVAMALIVFQFILPFLILLSRGNKARIERLAWVAALIILMRALDAYWLVKPAFHPAGPQVHWLDVVTFLSVGAVWIAAFLGRLPKRPDVVGVYLGETAA
jgi:hypothetical protein